MTTPTAGQRWWDTVLGRTVAVAVSAALITAAVALLVSLPLLRTAGLEQSRSQLAGLADVAAATLADPRPGSLVRLRNLLVGQDIEAFAVIPDRPSPEGVPAEVLAPLLVGLPVSETYRDGGRLWLLEGRPLGAGGIALAAPVEVSTDAVYRSLRRLAAALLVGLAAAVAVAAVAANRLTAPLRRVADAAAQLAVGRRDVQVAPDGPREVAEIAGNMNRLSQALATSEGRQREFLLSVSHELRTPLTAVTGYAEAIADGVVPAADLAGTGRLMSQEAQRLDRLVADLLDLSRLGAADLRIEQRSTDLRESVAAAAAVWRDRCARERVRLEWQAPSEPLTVITDPVRVRQILDNLAENALRVTPAGGVIVLALAKEPGAAVIEVRDSGPGLTPQDLSEAFEPGVLHSRYRGVRPVGSGVGLALVGRLAARLGGAASASVAPEGGAAFTVRLPLSA